MNSIKQCSLCTRLDDSLERSLYDMAHMEQRDLKTLAGLSNHHAGGLFDRARDFARRRMDAERQEAQTNRSKLSHLRQRFFDELIGELASGGSAGRLIDGYMNDNDRHVLEEHLAHEDMERIFIEEKDVAQALESYVREGLIDFRQDGYMFTPKGCRRLAGYILRKIMEEVRPVAPGINFTADEGFGTREGFVTKKYEFGDEFSRIDTEATLLGALAKKGCRNGMIGFDEGDLRVRETIADSRVTSGLIVDVSSSMAGEKLRSAMDISMALAGLIGRVGRDSLRIFVFSHTVQEVPFWEMPNKRYAGNITDMRAALRRFRLAVSSSRGDRQGYLVTDTAPNSENGTYVGFERAIPGVIEEARQWRLAGITLNIIMLDETEHLREFSSELAKHNAGRVFFSRPADLGRIVLKDYLKNRRKRGR